MSLETWEIDRLASSANFSLVMSWVSQRSRILSPGLFKRSWRSGCSMEKLLSDLLSQHRENPKVFQGTARKKHSLQAMVFLLACVIIIDFYLVYHYPPPRGWRLFQKELKLFIEIQSRKQLSLSGGHALWSPLFRQRKSYPSYRSQVFGRVIFPDVTSVLVEDNVQPPVECILDSPMIAYTLSDFLSIKR